jgi:Fur family transcriptional regulator, ferric uptake regulator
MQSIHAITDNLKKEGFKITKIRLGIIDIFLKRDFPIAASDLIESFDLLKIPVNKTTIYRELDFLQERQIIKEVEFGEGKKRYELEDLNHHHHLVCLKCKRVQDIEVKINLQKEEKRIEKRKRFKIRNHNLEFFGYCSDCI